MEKEKRTKIRYNVDLDELSGDEDWNDFSEDENTNVYYEDPEHQSDTEERFIFTETLCYPIMIVKQVWVVLAQTRKQRW